MRRKVRIQEKGGKEKKRKERSGKRGKRERRADKRGELREQHEREEIVTIRGKEKITKRRGRKPR